MEDFLSLNEYMHFCIASDSKSGDKNAMTRFSSPIQVKSIQKWVMTKIPFVVNAAESFRLLPNGIRHGKCETYWTVEKFNHKQISEYFKGVLHGKITTYTHEGKEEINFRNGKMHGVCSRWDKYGELVKSREFKKGIVS